MTPELLQYLCDPSDYSPLSLENPTYSEDGHILSGELSSLNGNKFPIINGIPRFTGVTEVKGDTVEHFGNQWNKFNFDQYYLHWKNHTIKNTFDSTDYFKGKTCVDCGGGSGMQTKWMAESGAEHVICLELSHAVDGIIQHNLQGMKNVDIVQCSIDMPPIKPQSIEGLVICHNVIQHTPSVEKTADALWNIVGKNGEFAFNCYTRMEDNWVYRLRFKFYQMVRSILSKSPFWFIQLYAHFVTILSFIPFMDKVLSKAMLLHRGDVPEEYSGFERIKRLYNAGVLNTTDYFGSHSYQHHKSYDELKELAHHLQPEEEKILNQERFFARPQYIGAALRVCR